MPEELSIQWEPRDGPPRKLTFEPTEEGWHRRTEIWDGQEWHEQDVDVVTEPSIYAPDHATKTEQTPPTLPSLLDGPHLTWGDDNPEVLVFDRPGSPIAIGTPAGILRYYSHQLPTAQPITKQEIRTLIRTFGLPTVTPLAQTPYTREDFSRGDFDVC